MGTHNNAHDGLPEGHPSCVSHFGIDAGACVVVPQPELSGRRARCAYYGKPTRRNECEQCRDNCTHETDSSTELPFFASQPEKEFDEFYCGCHSWD